MLLLLLTLLLLMAMTGNLLHKASVKKRWLGSDNDVVVLMLMLMMMVMVTQHIPTRWESDIMMKGGNMTLSNFHHTQI